MATFCIPVTNEEYLSTHALSESILSGSAHSTFYLDQRRNDFLVFLSSTNNLQTNGSVCKRLRAIHVVYERVLFIHRDVLGVGGIQLRVHFGHREDDAWVIQEIPVCCVGPPSAQRSDNICPKEGIR